LIFWGIKKIGPKSSPALPHQAVNERKISGLVIPGGYPLDNPKGIIKVRFPIKKCWPKFSHFSHELNSYGNYYITLKRLPQSKYNEWSGEFFE